MVLKQTKIQQQLTIAARCSDRNGLVRVAKQPRDWALNALWKWIEPFDTARKHLSARRHTMLLLLVRNQMRILGIEAYSQSPFAIVGSPHHTAQRRRGTQSELIPSVRRTNSRPVEETKRTW